MKKRAFAIVICIGLIAVTIRADDRVKQLQSEIEDLSHELEIIKKKEAGILGELRKIESERALGELKLKQVTLTVDETEQRIAEREKRISETVKRIDLVKSHLRDGLEELYKLGKMRHFRILLSAQNQRESLQFFKYATYLADRDGRNIVLFRQSMRTLKKEKEMLDRQRKDLLEKREILSQRKEMLLKNESSRRALLKSIQEKKEVHYEALDELRSACDELEKLVHSFGSEGAGAEILLLDTRKFKGLLQRPAKGRISASFGRIKHPKFGTELPHNGIDIEAPMGADIRAIFDGKVVFAEWFKGYGLTIIMDHGSKILSIYSHASAILVEKGEFVRKGALIGKVGDSGSLKGAYLYFEIRDAGKAVDPERWLSER